jgi:hypothetical protein
MTTLSTGRGALLDWQVDDDIFLFNLSIIWSDDFSNRYNYGMWMRSSRVDEI